MAQTLPSRRAVLSYTLGSGAEHCPDDARLRDLVAARLGYDAFVESADLHVAVAIDAAAGTLRAHITVRDAASDRHGQRDLSSDDATCRELGEAAALAVALAVDPRAATSPLPTPALPTPVDPDALDPDAVAPAVPVPPPVPCPVSTTSAAQARAPTESRVRSQSRRASPPGDRSSTPTLRFGAGILGALGTEPALTTGGLASVGVRLDRVSLSVEGRMDLATSRVRADGSGVRASLASGSVVGCHHVDRFALCALAIVGALRGRGVGVESPREDTSVYAAFGLRPAASLPLYGPLGLRIQTDLAATITPTTLRVDGQARWSLPVLAGSVAIVLEVAVEP